MAHLYSKSDFMQQKEKVNFRLTISKVRKYTNTTRKHNFTDEPDMKNNTHFCVEIRKKKWWVKVKLKKWVQIGICICHKKN